MSKTRAGSGQVQTNLKFEGTAGIVLPVGNTSARNPSPVAGEIRYNNQLGIFEGYTGTVWGAMGPWNSQTVDYFVGDGSTYQFTCDFTVTNVNNIIVTLNGVQLTPNIDWKLDGTNVINFTESDGTVNPPENASEIIVRGFNPLTSATVVAGSITAADLATTNSGTNGQVLSINSSGNLTYITVPNTQPTSLTVGGVLSGTTATATLNNRTVGIAQLNVTDGTYGQVLATDGNGHLTFITPAFTASTLKLPALQSAPTATSGTFAVADGVTWDPATKATGKPYPVFYDGTSWQPLY